jgi:hypothetical protein
VTVSSSGARHWSDSTVGPRTDHRASRLSLVARRAASDAPRIPRVLDPSTPSRGRPSALTETPARAAGGAPGRNHRNRARPPACATQALDSLRTTAPSFGTGSAKQSEPPPHRRVSMRATNVALTDEISPSRPWAVRSLRQLDSGARRQRASRVSRRNRGRTRTYGARPPRVRAALTSALSGASATLSAPEASTSRRLLSRRGA